MRGSQGWGRLLGGGSDRDGGRRRVGMVRGRLCAAVPIVVLAAPGVARADLAPFGHQCNFDSTNSVRFCPTVTTGTTVTADLTALKNRVPSFDGTPLDVDVTLPASGSGPFPTIVMLHGLGNDKTTFESGGNPNFTADYNNVFYAQHGYAVVNYTARGYGKSCGDPTSRISPDCDHGWTHLADQRYEARDTQSLLGELVDEGITQPSAIGVTGMSYGGGQSIELAYLKNRIRCAGENLPGDPCDGQPNGALIPWTSAEGTPLAIAAAYARWPWSDLVSALLPNGRFLDTGVAGPSQSRSPLGVELQSSFSSVVYSGQQLFAAPQGVDPSADLTTWYGVLSAGEPYGPEAQAIADELHSYHGGDGLSGMPAPLLLESGWNDELFPVEQALRVYTALRANSPGAKVALQIGDLGHPSGADKPLEDLAFDDQASGFFDAWLRGVGSAPAPGSVSAYTQTCSWWAPAGGAYTAPRWTALPTGTITFGSAAPQTVLSDGGSAALAAQEDPVIDALPGVGATPLGHGGDACQTVPAETDPGTAVYTTTTSGMTMMGMPTVTATIMTTGPFGELAARLWDVRPDGTQRLITRGVYRLLDNQQGTITFQLHGNAYMIGAGDTIKLELLGRDAPYYRASNGTFTVQMSNVTVTLPTIGSTWYNVINQASGSCVDALGIDNGTVLQQSACGNQQPSQEWQLQPTDSGYNLVFNRNASAEDPTWDVTGGEGATADGTPIQLWEYHSDPSNQHGAYNEQWQSISLGNGYYKFVARNSLKCLGVPGGTTANGVQLQQSTCNGSPEQAFRVVQQQ